MIQAAMFTDSHAVQKVDTAQIVGMLRYGRIDSCRRDLGEFFDQSNYRLLESQMLRLYVGMDVYFAAQNVSQEYGISAERFVARFGELDDISDRLRTIDSTTEYLLDMVEQCIRWRIASAVDNGNDLVKKAKDYIDKNYMNEEISLKTTAEHVGLSPTYLSALFKREMKENFTEYLTEIRIRKAKELLCSTSKLVCEIAYEVGFRDYRYFSQIFKKHTGQTPKKFQSSANQFA
ncbi:MAG: helix-turn-helix domain-containing protein [Oscillospiraceae bacterium]|nr:helix-turn-helix domain-containing protein [Oscillospiraceae bacterium]